MRAMRSFAKSAPFASGAGALLSSSFRVRNHRFGGRVPLRGKGGRDMSDDRRTDDAAVDEDAHGYHSALEMDDSSGWRAWIVPVAMLIVVIGGVAFLFLYQGDQEPDPRIANRLGNPERTIPLEPGGDQVPEITAPDGSAAEPGPAIGDNAVGPAEAAEAQGEGGTPPN
jgi:hypothetical protein